MTKKDIIRKLERLDCLFCELQEDIEDLISENQDRMSAIEDRAAERDSGEMTEREEERYCALEEENENLQCLEDELCFDVEDLILNYLEN